VGLITSAMLVVPTSGAAISAPSGDTCSITGTGTSYTAVINIPSSGAEQSKFAFGAPGGTVTNVVGVGATTTSSTTNLPAGTNVALALSGAAVPGASVTATVTTSAPVAGSFTLVPGNRDGTVWFDPVVCQHPVGTPTPSNKFTARSKATYNAATGTWRAAVVVPGPGKLIFAHRTIVQGGTPRPLIKSGKLSVGKAGQFMLTLRPTAAGTAALNSTGRIKLSLNIEFSPTNGKPANKLVALTLRK
jgi:hypothetical protein